MLQVEILQRDVTNSGHEGNNTKTLSLSEKSNHSGTSEQETAMRSDEKWKLDTWKECKF